MFIENNTKYDDNGIPLGVRILPDGSVTPRIDAKSFGYHPFGSGLVRDWFTKWSFTKFDDNDPENQKIAYTKSGWKLEPENIRRDWELLKWYVMRPIVAPVRVVAIALILLFVQGTIKLPMILGPIAVDAADSHGTPPTSGTVTNYSHTCTGSNLYLVSAGTLDTAIGTSTWQYNTVDLAKDISQPGNQIAGTHLGSLINPATGANDLSFTRATGTFTTNGKGHLMGISFTGAKQSGQPDATVGVSEGAKTSSTVTLTTVADNCFIVDSEAINTNPTTAAAAQTSISNATGIDNSASGSHSCSYRSVGAAGSYTMTWTWSASVGYDAVALSLAPAPVTTALKDIIRQGVVPRKR